MKKRKNKINETDKIIIAICVLVISIGYALITSSFSADSKSNNDIQSNTIKKEEYIYTINTRNTIYLNKPIDDKISIYKTPNNKSIYLKHKVKNIIKWSITDNENTFYFDSEKECEGATNDKKYPELSRHTCKKQILRIPIESYIGFVIENSSVTVGEYSIKATSEAYIENKEIMKKTFGESLCIDNSSSFSCNISNLKITIFDNGSINATKDNYSCSIDSDGSSYCNE